MAATQAKRRRQAILKLIFFLRLFELLLRAEMLVDAICRTAIDYLYPTIAPDRILPLTVTLYLATTWNRSLAAYFPGHLELGILVRDSFYHKLFQLTCFGQFAQLLVVTCFVAKIRRYVDNKFKVALATTTIPTIPEREFSMCYSLRYLRNLFVGILSNCLPYAYHISGLAFVIHNF